MGLRDELHQRLCFYRMCYMLEGCERFSVVTSYRKAPTITQMPTKFENSDLGLSSGGKNPPGFVACGPGSGSFALAGKSTNTNISKARSTAEDRQGCRLQDLFRPPCHGVTGILGKGCG